MSNNMYKKIKFLIFSVKYQEGIHFPMVNQILKIVKENEAITRNLRHDKRMLMSDIKRENTLKYDDFDEQNDDFHFDY